MASLSLPRVLQQRKTSLEIERENFEKTQATAIQKAINNVETPVKQKHVRLTIIGTFQEQGAKTFWTVALRLPAMDDRIVAWKLCHVVHKVLREGHPLSLLHSQRHKKDLDEIGKLWGHLKEGYGKMIRLYTSLIMTKLDFHRRNPRFPGSLGVSRADLENIGGNDIDNYFQMSVEMFDYMDAILELQAAIFGSLDMSRSNSMTSSGQCRLAPLIACIQDASRLYDLSVKILFRLHSALPPDVLCGHRDRFLKQFKELRQFYHSTNNLQYFRNLISIPTLPEHPPNFLVQAELRTYVTQEVVVPPEEDPEPVEANLIDTSFVDSTDSASQGSRSPAPSHTELIVERDGLIEHLQTELTRLRTEITKLVRDHQQSVSSLHERIVALETELATKESELLQERQVKEDLFIQASTVAQTQDSEQKARDEKFTKLKDLYVKLREDHIQLLRQKADVDKRVTVGTKRLAELQQEKSALDDRLRQLTDVRGVEEQQLQKAAAGHKEELEMLRMEQQYFDMEKEALQKSVDETAAQKDLLEVDLERATAQARQMDDQVAQLTVQLDAMATKFEQTKSDGDNRTKELLQVALKEAESIVQDAIHDVDVPILEAVVALRSLTPGAVDALECALELTHKNPAQVISAAAKIGHRLSTFILQGHATSNSSPDIMFGDRMADACKQLGETVVLILQGLHENRDVKPQINAAIEYLRAVAALADTLMTSLKEGSPEELADMVDNELSAMDKAIEEAANRIQDLLSKSRTADSGIKLEVNEKILDSCTTLMQAIKVLIQKSRLLQGEIVAQGKGTASAKEFYKRNHKWTDGLISAAKAIAVAAKFLLSSADEVVTGSGKLEQLVVAAQEIAASTAQLVVASRVKADRRSANLQGLTQASKGVTNATGGVVATVKDCSQLIDDVEELDTSGLSLHQAKRLEMEAQVRVLELEKELEQERLRFSALRRHHYQLEDVANNGNC